jgi:hypothetical protein
VAAASLGELLGVGLLVLGLLGLRLDEVVDDVDDRVVLGHRLRHEVAELGFVPGGPHGERDAQGDSGAENRVGDLLRDLAEPLADLPVDERGCAGHELLRQQLLEGQVAGVDHVAGDLLRVVLVLDEERGRQGAARELHAHLQGLEHCLFLLLHLGRVGVPVSVRLNDYVCILNTQDEETLHNT